MGAYSPLLLDPMEGLGALLHIPIFPLLAWDLKISGSNLPAGFVGLTITGFYFVLLYVW